MTTPPANTNPQSEAVPERYDADMACAIETRWQTWWDEQNTYRVANPGEPGFDPDRPKYFCLDMFPYPSGAGLHVGHPEGYTATDIVSRFRRMKGFHVLHPMGWDAFGLPAEQHAINTGEHPARFTRSTIDTFRRQLKRFGFSYDWSREFATIDEDYYKWTQWIFLRIYNSWYDAEENRARPIDELIAGFESGDRVVRLNPGAAEYSGSGDLPDGTRVGQWRTLDPETRRMIVDSYRLAYVGMQTVNWCPRLGTALANEEVIDGRSERGGHPVFRKPMRQWMFRITAYADRLVEGLTGLDWPGSTKTQQTEWIGRSEGAEIEFPILTSAGTSPLRGESGSSPTPTVAAGIGDVLRFLEAGINAFSPVGFVPRDPYPEGISGAIPGLSRTDRLLPHLRLPNATYFVTWKSVEHVVFDDTERGVVLDALRNFDGDRCRVYAAVVMSNHVHWLIRPFDGHSLDELVTSIKRFTANQVNKARTRTGHVWQAEQFDHIVRDSSHFGKYVDYILKNPVEAGLAATAEHYPWLFVHRESLGGAIAGHSPESHRGQETEIAPEGRGTRMPTDSRLRVFTTRPDTLFGATYMVVAPEHPLVDEALNNPTPETPTEELRLYVDAARNRSDVERQEAKGKTGVFTGYSARNPATGECIPIWTGDYVLMGYGTGAIMAVPGQDQRDWDFASEFHLPIIRTVRPPEDFSGEAFTGDGPSMNSGFLDGLHVPDAKARMIEWLEDKGLGMRRVTYRLRDWLFSRQRYWGEPFPIVWDERGNHHPVSDDALPVVLPDMADYAPVESDDPQPLLGKATGWVHTTAAAAMAEGLPPDAPVARETNTMPGWAGSCWYYLRYCDPHNAERLVGCEAEKYWMDGSGVDLYIGGNEHAVLHLLYARFWHKVLFDLGHVSTDEPIRRLFHQGMIVSHAFQRADGGLVPTDQVWELTSSDNAGGFARIVPATGGEAAGSVDTPDLPRAVYEQLQRDGSVFVLPGDNFDPESDLANDVEVVTRITAKMSKSLKNVVNPDDVIAEYGADTFRLYEMYMGPLEASKPWNTRDIVGLYRFLQRAWRLLIDEKTGGLRLADNPDPDTEKRLHRTIHKVGGDIDRLGFNTAIAALIEFVNAAGVLSADQADRFVRTLAPLTPHIAEELWHRLGRQDGLGSVALQPWPTVDEAMLVDDEIEVPVQILGKLRSKIVVPADADEATMREAALADPRIAELIAGKTVRKVVVVSGRLVNIVAN